MSSHSSSQTTVSFTKLCIKNNFLLKFIISASCFSPLTVCSLVSPTTLFLFCWILSLPLSPPAYFPQRSIAFNSIHHYCFCYFTLWFFATPTTYTILYFCYFYAFQCLCPFISAYSPLGLPQCSLSFPLCSLSSSASRLFVSFVYPSVPIFIGHVQSIARSR